MNGKVWAFFRKRKMPKILCDMTAMSFARQKQNKPLYTYKIRAFLAIETFTRHALQVLKFFSEDAFLPLILVDKWHFSTEKRLFFHNF